MTIKSKIEYRINKLKDLTKLNLKDDILLKSEKSYSHRLSIEFKDLTMDDITIRYSSTIDFLYVLDSMIKLLELMNRDLKDEIDDYIDSNIYQIIADNRDVAIEVLKP